MLCGTRAAHDSPAVANHTDAFAFRHAIVLGRFFQVFLAPNSLRITEASLGHGITIAPR